MGLDVTDPLESLRARWAEREPAADGLRQSGRCSAVTPDLRPLHSTRIGSLLVGEAFVALSGCQGVRQTSVPVCPVACRLPKLDASSATTRRHRGEGWVGRAVPVVSHVERTSGRADPDARPAGCSLRLLGSPPRPPVGERCRRASEASALWCGFFNFS